MMSSPNKQEPSTSGFESDAQSIAIQPLARKLNLVESIRVGLTVVALCCGIIVLGVSAHTLSVYNWTNLPTDFLLPIWPENFDARPTVALVVGSTIIVVSNLVSLACSKVSSLRNKQMVHTAMSFSAPLVGLIAAVIAMAFFYSVNTSATDDTMQSWTCRWETVIMTLPPHFGTLCKESRAGLYLSILLIPIEALVLGVAGWQFAVEKQASQYGFTVRKGSPQLH
ncbi:hypothetical protein MKZ38_005401 [Zalerion maritima]|uniref:Uncharacterized protein n=1 Tax=Zalerion maritima TaxID=339359 RepID=A0AAD5RL88_9PEZI|nr:hypothetical protein MKZ38_005401 [Zalerion maritima]